MSVRTRIIQSISNWFHGTYVPYDNPPGSSVIMVGGYYDRHWTAKMTGAIGRFVAAEWKWILGTAIALLAIYINYSPKH